jgi:hypothetical protein
MFTGSCSVFCLEKSLCTKGTEIVLSFDGCSAMITISKGMAMFNIVCKLAKHQIHDVPSPNCISDPITS